MGGGLPQKLPMLGTEEGTRPAFGGPSELIMMTWCASQSRDCFTGSSPA